VERANDEVGGVFLLRPESWSSLGEIRDHERIVIRASVLSGGSPFIPGALILDFSVELRPACDFLFSVNKGEYRAWVDFHVRVLGQFQHAKCVGDFLVAPLVTADNSDSKRLHVWRLQQKQDRLLVSGCWAARVLIDDDFAFASRECGSVQGCEQDQTKEDRTSWHVLLPPHDR
jgi:hypothetical protein